jgi:antibiotic biosynthesis monooxygenase (ABM) superfamily enzyme
MAQPDNATNEPVTIVFSWTVKPGKEQLFEQRMHEIHKVARTFPGHMGVTTLKSPTRTDSFQTVLRFDNTKHLQAWFDSPIRQQLMNHLIEVASTDEAAKATGLETWFEIPGQTIIPPPRWKMAITTSIAIYPLALLFFAFLAPYIELLPVWIRALFLPILAPIILTYLFMPFLTQRVLKGWLYKSR